jgi:hypothetical protein
MRVSDTSRMPENIYLALQNPHGDGTMVVGFFNSKESIKRTTSPKAVNGTTAEK